MPMLQSRLQTHFAVLILQQMC